MVRLTARCSYHCASNCYTRYYWIVTYKRQYKFLLLCCTIFITWQKKPDIHPAAWRIYLPTFSCFILVERKVKVASEQAIRLYEGEGVVGRGGKYHPILKLSIKCRLVFDSFHNHSTCYWLLNRLKVWTWGVPSRSVCEIKEGWRSVKHNSSNIKHIMW